MRTSRRVPLHSKQSIQLEKLSLPRKRMRGWRWEEIAKGDDENQSQWTCREEGGHTGGWTPGMDGGVR